MIREIGREFGSLRTFNSHLGVNRELTLILHNLNSVMLCNQTDVGLILVLELTGCLTLGKSPYLHEPQFPPSQNGDTNGHFRGLL